MTEKWVNSIWWKFMLYGLASAVITAAILYSCNLLILSLLDNPLFLPPIAGIINRIGSLPVFIVTGCFLYIMSFFLLSRRMIRRIENIDLRIKRIGEGQFDSDQALPSASDEFGIIAASIDLLSHRLKKDLEQIFIGLRAIADGLFDQPIPVEELSGELARVADSINQMAEKLHSSIMEERNAERSKNDLITGVSHDLRTPLTSILGFLEVIDEDRYQDEVELRHYVSIAYEKSRSLKKLIDDLFEYTRINNGMPLNKSELDLVGFVQQLAEEFVPQLGEAGVTCRIQSDVPSLPVQVDGDLLVRSFGNLILNAIRYGKDGQYVDISVQQTDTEAVVSIVNYGEPIPQSDLPFIFDRFYRVERSRSTETGGTGLGLAIVKSIIEVHGGRISVYSNRDKTAFTTCLPLKS
jgi:signal transduction histidine kinase